MAKETVVKLTVADNFSAQLRAFAQAIDANEKHVSKTSQAMQQLGNVAKTAAIAGFGALTGAIAVSIQKSAELESTFGKIAGLTNTAKGSIDGLRESVVRMSTEMPVGANELAQGLYFISSSGFQGAEAMEILRTSAQAASAGLGETKVIADAVTSALSAYGTGASDAARITDLLTFAVKEGKGEPDELAAGLGRILPIAAAAGVGMEDVAAAVAVMTRTSGNADEAFTALRGTIGALLAPAKQSVDALAAIGLTTEDVSGMLKKPGGLVEVLRLLMERTGGNVEQLDLIIPNIRALTGVLSLAGKQGEEYARVLNDAYNAEGLTAAAAKTMGETMEAKLKIAQNSVEAFGMAITQKLLPGLGQAAEAVTVLLTASDKLTEAVVGVNNDLLKSAPSYDAYITGTLGAAVAAGKLTQAQADQFIATGKITDAGMGQIDITEQIITQYGIATREAYGLTKANAEISQGAKNQADVYNVLDAAMSGAKDSTDGVTEANYSAIESQKQLAAEAKLSGEYYGSLTSSAISYTESAREMAKLQEDLAGATGKAKDSILEQIKAMQLQDNQARAMEGFKILEEQLKGGVITVDQYKERTDILNNTTHLFTQESLAAAQAQQSYLNVLADPNASVSALLTATQAYSASLRTDYIPTTEAAAQATKGAKDKLDEMTKYADTGKLKGADITIGADTKPADKQVDDFKRGVETKTVEIKVSTVTVDQGAPERDKQQTLREAVSKNAPVSSFTFPAYVPQAEPYTPEAKPKPEQPIAAGGPVGIAPVVVPVSADTRGAEKQVGDFKEGIKGPSVKVSADTAPAEKQINDFKTGTETKPIVIKVSTVTTDQGAPERDKQQTAREAAANIRNAADSSTAAVTTSLQKANDGVSGFATKSKDQVKGVGDTTQTTFTKMADTIAGKFGLTSKSVSDAFAMMQQSAVTQIGTINAAIETYLPTYRELIYQITIRGSAPEGEEEPGIPGTGAQHGANMVVPDSIAPASIPGAQHGANFIAPEIPRSIGAQHGISIVIPDNPLRAQNGANFIVPENRRGGMQDYYPVIAAPGERVIVQTVAQQQQQRSAAAERGGDTNNYNITINDKLAAAMWLDKIRREKIARSEARMGV